MESFFESIPTEQITFYALRVIGALIFLFVAWMVAAWLGRMTRKGLERANVDQTLTKFFGNLMRYAILVMAILSCLNFFGVETTSFAAVIAATGFAIGLALQGTLSNFSAGVMLLIFRPFKVGDVISVGGVTGKVDEVELFTTKLDTQDNRRYILPNSTVFGSAIENITYHPIRRVDVAVGTDYPADLAETRRVLEAAAKTVKGGLQDPPPQIYLVDLGDSSINWQVRVWCNTDDYFDVWEQTTNDTKNALDAAGIGIPYPQMDVHVDGVSS